jgi:hypothetical protein
VDPEVQNFAQVMAILVPSIVVLIASGVIGHRFVIRTERGAAPRPSKIDDERFTRLEQAVEAVAIEVERISEGQRFVTRVLAERNCVLEPLRGAERVITPH